MAFFFELKPTRWLCGLAITILLTPVVAQERLVKYEVNGKVYDQNGTLMGPLELTIAEKLARVDGFVGKRCVVVRRDGSYASDALLLKLRPDSFGVLDSFEVRSHGWTNLVPVSDISEIRSGPQSVSLAEHPRRMLKLRRALPPDKLENIKRNRSELLQVLRDVTTRQSEFANERDRFEASVRAAKDTLESADRVTAKHAKALKEIASAQRELTFGERRLEETRVRQEKLAARLSALEANLAEREKRLADRASLLRGKVVKGDGFVVGERIVFRKFGEVIEDAPITAGGFFYCLSLRRETDLADYELSVTNHKILFRVNHKGELSIDVEEEKK